MPATFLLWAALLAGAAWLASALRRLQIYWDAGENRLTRSGQALRQRHRELEENAKTLEQLERDIVKARRVAEKARADEKERRGTLHTIRPPAPLEIFVTSEFSASPSEVAWIADMQARTETSQAGPPPVRPLLLWAGSHKAAVARARRISSEGGHGDAIAVRRFSSEDE